MPLILKFFGAHYIITGTVYRKYLLYDTVQYIYIQYIQYTCLYRSSTVKYGKTMNTIHLTVCILFLYYIPYIYITSIQAIVFLVEQPAISHFCGMCPTDFFREL
jgi:hypothetical protein